MVKEKQNNYRTVLICAALVFVTIAAYEPVRNNEFVFYDDTIYITENPNIQSGFNWESIWWAFTAYHSGNWHPLTWLSHMLDYQLFGLNPEGHHFVNLFLHIISSVLLFWILKQMTGRTWASAFAACLFAIHPQRVESVAWASERKDVLSGLFFMITISAYIRYSEKPGIGRYILVLVSMVFGLMSKGMLVTLPFVLLLLDYWPLRRFTFFGEPIKSKYSTGQLSKLLVEKIPFFVLAFSCSIIAFITQKGGEAISELTELPLMLRIKNATVSYIGYIVKMIYPVRLAALYPFEINIPLWKFIICLSLLFSITLGVILTARKKPYLITGWLWYLGTLVPVIGLIQIGSQSMADRYTYLSSIGLFIMFTWGVSNFLSSYHYRKIVFSVSSVVIILIMIILTRVQVGYWKNDLALAGHAVEVTKNNYVMYINLGIAFNIAGNSDEAIRLYHKALSIDPQNAKAHYNLAFALSIQGKLEEAISHYRQAIKFKPDYIKALVNLGNLFKARGNLDEAISQYRKVLKIEPNHAQTHYNLGTLLSDKGKLDEAISHFRQVLKIEPNHAQTYYNLGILLSDKGKIDEAISHYRQALKIKPNYAQIHFKLGTALQSKGNLDEAISQYHQVLQVEPNDVQTHFNLGEALRVQGKLDEAISQYHKAVKIKPNFVLALNNLAWILATNSDAKIRNEKQAIELAKRAAELTNYQHTGVLDTLAAAQAATGQFEEAVETAQKAIELASKANNNAIVTIIRKRLQLYEQKKTYQEPMQK